MFQGMLALQLIPRQKLMATPIGSTGSAGLIQTIQQYVRHSWPAAILGTVATTGWVMQGVGNALYYRQVGAETGPLSNMLMSAKIYAHHTAAGHTMEKASFFSIVVGAQIDK